MPDILDTLEWKPWPKDETWRYADIPDVARISRKLDSDLYSVRSKFNQFRLDEIDRSRTLLVVEELMRLASQSETESTD